MKSPNRLDNALIASLVAALLVMATTVLIESQLGEPLLVQAPAPAETFSAPAQG